MTYRHMIPIPFDDLMEIRDALAAATSYFEEQDRLDWMRNGRGQAVPESSPLTQQIRKAHEISWSMTEPLVIAQKEEDAANGERPEVALEA